MPARMKINADFSRRVAVHAGYGVAVLGEARSHHETDITRPHHPDLQMPPSLRFIAARRRR